MGGVDWLIVVPKRFDGKVMVIDYRELLPIDLRVVGVSNSFRVLIDVESPVIEIGVVIRTENHHVLDAIGAVVWRVERSEVMVLRVTCSVRSCESLVTHLTAVAIPLF